MPKRYGPGEFERVDVDVRHSTWEMRLKFLGILADRRSEIFIDLVLPPAMDRQFIVERTRQEQGALFFSLVALAYGKVVTIGTQVVTGPVETPFGYFIGYLQQNQKRLRAALKEVRATQGVLNESDSQGEGIAKLIPSWKDLLSDVSAKPFCASLLKWAKDRNVNEDWVIDYALVMLRHLKIRFDGIVKSISELKWDEPTCKKYQFVFDVGFRESRKDSNLKYYYRKVSVNYFTHHNIPELPPFKFNYGKFQFPATHWRPQFKTKLEFKSEVTAQFQRTIDALVDFNDCYEYIDEDGFTLGLTQYCDSVDEALKNNPNESQLAPYSTEHFGALQLYSSTWRPSIMTKNEFISIYLKEVNRGFLRSRKWLRPWMLRLRKNLKIACFCFVARLNG